MKYEKDSVDCEVFIEFDRLIGFRVTDKFLKRRISENLFSVLIGAEGRVTLSGCSAIEGFGHSMLTDPSEDLSESRDKVTIFLIQNIEILTRRSPTLGILVVFDVEGMHFIPFPFLLTVKF